MANAIALGAMLNEDPTKLPHVLVAGGVGEAAAAVSLALFKSPSGLFLLNKALFYSYYGILIAVVLFGVAEAWTGLWVKRDPPNRRAVGMTVLWVSVLPLIFLGGVGGFEALKLN